MKKLLFIALSATLFCSCASIQPVPYETPDLQYTEAASMYWASDFTGGTTGCLDKISSSILSDGDAARVVKSGVGSFDYIYDDDSGAAEDSPGVIQPDDATGDERWVVVPYDADYISDGSTNAIPTLTQETNWETAYGWGDYSSAIGSTLQAWDTDLDTWATLTPSANFQTLATQTFAQMRGSLDLEAGTDFYSTGDVDTAVGLRLLITAIDDTPADDPDVPASSKWIYDNIGTSISANIKSFLGSANYSAARTNLGIDTAANLETSLSLGAYASDILGAADSDALVTLLGLVAGDIPDLSATYQPLHANLTSWAGQTSAANKLGYWTGSGTSDVTDLTAQARTFLALSTSEAMWGNLLPYRTSAPASPVAGQLYCADETTWNPAGTSLGKGYCTIYDGASYILKWDEDGNDYANGIEVPTHLAAELDDDDGTPNATPFVLIASELQGSILSNSGAVGAWEYDFPAQSEGWNFIYMIEAAQNVTLDPNGTEAWYMNGSACGAGDPIANTSPTVGESVSCISTEGDVYCKSSDADWGC